MNKAKHYCDNINCNHNDTKGLCCLFNPDNCKYRQLQEVLKISNEDIESIKTVIDIMGKIYTEVNTVEIE